MCYRLPPVGGYGRTGIRTTLNFGPATPESVHQRIESDRLLRREPFFILDHFGAVEPLLGVVGRFFKPLLFKQLNEVNPGVRRDDDIEICREASSKR